MSTDRPALTSEADAPRKPALVTYIAITAALAVTASTAAFASAMLALPTWAMFVGWVAYFTRRPSAREGLGSFACVLLGLALGCVAVLLLGGLAPTLGRFALPAVVFVIGGTVIATRGLPILNNLLGYFLGLISFFASHLEPALGSVAELGGAAALGSVAGWIGQTLEGRVRAVTQA